MAYSAYTDQELIALLKQGDHAAFTEIYDRYRGVLYLYAYKLTQGTDDAEDIVQDIFIYLWDKAGTLVFNVSLKAYLYTAVRYKFFNMLDHKKVISRHEESFTLFACKVEFITDNKVRENELTRLIELEISKLPEKMRIVFEMNRKDNFPAAEIARQLSISDKTVKRQLANAVKILRVKLSSVFCGFFTGLL
jgi:RNA polymerase sigma-70 factor (ECF subfamily)